MYSIVFVYLFFLVCPVWTNNEWIEHFTYLDIDFVMNCSLNFVTTNNMGARWYLPNGKMIKTDDKYQLDRNLLHIKKVSEQDTGLYTCKVEEMKKTVRQIHTLNIGGPMYHSIHEQYYLNFVVAAVACAIVCFLIISLCLIYHFRYKNPNLLGFSNESEISYDTQL